MGIRTRDDCRECVGGIVYGGWQVLTGSPIAGHKLAPDQIGAAPLPGRPGQLLVANFSDLANPFQPRCKSTATRRKVSPNLRDKAH